MRLVLTAFIAAAALTVIAAPHARAAELIFVSDQWCPYNCGPDSGKPGYVIEIATEILVPAGYSVRYLNVPWARALKGLAAGRYHGAPAAFKRPDRDFIYPRETVGVSVTGFVTDKGSTWTYTDLKSLAGIKTGIIKGYAYSGPLNGYFLQHPERRKFAHGEDALARSLKSLMRGDVDAVIDDENVLRTTIQLLGLGAKTRFAGRASGQEDLFLALSKHVPKAQEIAAVISRGIVRMRTSGRLAKILSSYNVKDWK